MKIPFLIAVTAVGVLLVGCAADGTFGQPRVVEDYSYYDTYEPRQVVVTSVPPRQRYERRTTRIPASYRDPVYVDGHYSWTGSNWAWQRGRYVNRPRPGTIWQQPTIYTAGNQRYYRSGYWR